MKISSQTFLFIGVLSILTQNAQASSCVVSPGENGRYALNDVREAMKNAPGLDQAAVMKVFDDANICIEDLALAANKEVAEASIESRDVSKEKLYQGFSRLLKSRNVGADKIEKVWTNTGDMVVNLASLRKRNFAQVLKSTSGDADHKARVLTDIVMARSLAKQLGFNEEMPKKLGLSYRNRSSAPSLEDITADLMREAGESHVGVKDRVRLRLLALTMHEIAQNILGASCEAGSDASSGLLKPRAPQSAEDAP